MRCSSGFTIRIAILSFAQTLLVSLAVNAVRAADLQEQLSAEDPAKLAADARRSGDARRGAILFYQPYLACATCHTAGHVGWMLGPDLARPSETVSGAHLVESVLEPSKVVKKGYETLTVQTVEGITLNGLLLEDRPDSIVLRDVARNGKQVTLRKQDIERQTSTAPSIMPAGMAKQLASRQQFLDLVCYLIEINEQGPARAQELQPAASLFAPARPPEYEQQIDHAGMIAELDDGSYKRGEAIYNRLCVNCHGTHEQVGSLPTSLRFASGQFKSGSDPYTMYRTLTYGFGMMVPQTWMVPRQKYDVVHYIREAYLREHNPTQYVTVDQAYLDRLPRGTTFGPKPSNIAVWERMNYGPNLCATYEIPGSEPNFAYKGIAVRLDQGPGGISRGAHWMLFDHDTLRVAAAWSGQGFIDWNGINFNDRHAVHPRIVGQISFANPMGPGWANPETGSFTDPRLRGRDGRRYGPLPRDWAHYKGMYHFGQRIIVSYSVGDASVLEMPGMETSGSRTVFTRTFNIGPRSRNMLLQVARHMKGAGDLRPVAGDLPRAAVVTLGPDSPAGAEVNGVILAGLAGGSTNASWQADASGNLRLSIPAGERPLRFVVWTRELSDPQEATSTAASLNLESLDLDLAAMTRGGPARWPEVLETPPVTGDSEGPFAIDVLTHPETNPWFCRMRFTGLDFFPDQDRLAVCSWDGDVWIVAGIRDLDRELSWRRVASGLFQPLGLKIVGGRIHVTCRDQLVILNDLNGDGETDFYQNFNNDHQVTEHFHEFAMGLQTDAQGNFYYAKSARHALPALVPHHGTLLRVSRDGTRTDIVANGFRAANGVCVNPDGTFIVTDQEGHWNPKNRINWVTEGGFYGNMFGYHDVTDSSDEAMVPPLCWITNAFDRSPAELLWVDSDAWGPLRGSLLNFSYGYGKVYVVPFETVAGRQQGGMCALPIPQFPTGVMRGRFHPGNGQLYTCGMYAWAGSQQQPGGLYRIRYTGNPVYLPTGLHATQSGLSITFSGRLDPLAAADTSNFAVKSWSLKRTANYGSDHYDERQLKVHRAALSDDLKTVVLEIPDIHPTWCMEIRYLLQSDSGSRVDGTIHNTIHHLSE